MNQLDSQILKNLYLPNASSHKGENGKVLVIGGSHLFHAASLWALSIASKLCDMVFYASVPENNEIVLCAKEEFRNGIVIRREDIDQYIREADSILIGPGLPREDGQQAGDDDTKVLTESLLKKYQDKKWVVDGGSLQVIHPEILPKTAIITPHQKEFQTIRLKSQNAKIKTSAQNANLGEKAQIFAKEYEVVVLLKGEKDSVCSPTECVEISGGNAGMTKGGTGDVLAGLTAALYAKNEAFLSACAASYINKKAGEDLFHNVGYFFNASDLVEQIPHTMKRLLEL